MKVLDIDVGDTREELDIWLTMDEEYMGLFTTKCSKKCCNVPNRYNQFDSATAKVADASSSRDDVQAYSHSAFPNAIYRLNVAGKVIEDEVSIAYGNYTTPIDTPEDEFYAPNGQQNNISTVFLGIEAVAPCMTLDYDGYIGLKPYDKTSETSKSINFMYNLKEKGYISHNVFSIYSQLDDDYNSSYIKFGGYDEGAVRRNHRLQFIKTSNVTTWGINLLSLHLGDVQ